MRDIVERLRACAESYCNCPTKEAADRITSLEQERAMAEALVISHESRIASLERELEIADKANFAHSETNRNLEAALRDNRCKSDVSLSIGECVDSGTCGCMNGITLETWSTDERAAKLSSLEQEIKRHERHQQTLHENGFTSVSDAIAHAISQQATITERNQRIASLEQLVAQYEAVPVEDMEEQIASLEQERDDLLQRVYMLETITPTEHAQVEDALKLLDDVLAEVDCYHDDWAERRAALNGDTK